MDLKKQTTISLFWNGFNKVGYQVIALLVGIITARLLTPTDFGYIAALAVFTMLSNILVESGFTAALVRREKNTNEEYSAAFLFNVLLSIFFYLILFIAAPAIAEYFNMPPLTKLARVLFSAIIINSFFIIPNIILTKELRFKEIAIAELGGVIISGIITIVMALLGYGYWAIAAQQISQLFVKVIIIWLLSKWRPTIHCDFKVLKEIFSFSFILIVTSIISTVTKYAYNFFIGPRYTSNDLGYYGQAFKFHQIPFTVISATITGVAYPVFSALNDEKERQMAYIQKTLRITAFITFPSMIGLYCIAPNFISVILTDKWMPMLPYFRILLLAGIAMPFFYLYQSIYNAIGKPMMNFKMDLLRNFLIIFFLFVLNESIFILLLGYMIANIISLIISGIELSRLTKYKIIEQIKNIFSSLFISIIMVIPIISIDYFINLNKIWILIYQITIGTITYIVFSWIFHIQIMNDIILILKKEYKKINKNK